MALITSMEAVPQEQVELSQLTAELTQALSPDDLASLVVHADGAEETPELTARLAAIAGTVAMQVRGVVPHYSNFHTWEYFRNARTETELRAIATSYPSSIVPFGNCLTMASITTEAWKDALLASNEAEITKYAGQVELVTSSWSQSVKSARDYHCMAMLRLRTCCIYLDINNSQPIRYVSLSTPANWVSCPPEERLDRKCHDVYLSIGDARLLITISPDSEYGTYGTLQSTSSEVPFAFTDPYRAVKGGIENAVVNLAQPSDSYDGLPNRRTVQIHKLCDIDPDVPSEFAPLAAGSAQGWVQMAELKVEFSVPSIWIQGKSFNQWLHRPENSEHLQKLRTFSGFGTTGPMRSGGAWFKIVLRSDAHRQLETSTLAIVRFMDELCAELGLPLGEILRIVNVVMEEWRKQAEIDEAVEQAEAAAWEEDEAAFAWQDDHAPASIENEE
ncbi:hypothetical protein NX059_003055 [Plenodomus lindquistii]|nr:hypothetical protein NX059_003055 [Plenodomus lindquistii]